MKAAQIPESSIIKVTGHTSERGLRSYDPEDEGEFRAMSNAVHNVANEVDLINIKKSQTKRPAVFNNPFHSWSTILEEEGESSTFQRQLAHPFAFSNCNVTINVNTPSSSNIKKRKRLRIYSSSEDELSQ